MEVSFVRDGGCGGWVRGHWDLKSKGAAPHSGPGTLWRLVCGVVWWGGHRWGAGRAWGGRREQSGAVQSQKETAPREGAGGGHCSSSEDSCEMPSSSSFSCGVGRAIKRMPGPPPPLLPPPEAKLTTPPPNTRPLQKGDESGLSVWVTQQPPRPSFIHKKEEFKGREKKKTTHTLLTHTARPLSPQGQGAPGRAQGTPRLKLARK